MEQVKKELLPEIVLTFHCWNQIDCSSDLRKFANSWLEFQNFLSMTKTFFSHSRSEQFW